MTKKILAERGGGNVFADIGLPDADEALAKAELARQIGNIIAGRRLTQAAAARLLGVDQPKISALLHGRLVGFSTDRLIRFLNALGRDVKIVIRPAPRSRALGRVQVAAA